MTTAQPWTVPDPAKGPTPDQFWSFNQLDTTLSIDGQPAENTSKECGPTSAANNIVRALGTLYGLPAGANPFPYPDIVHDMEWGQSYTGPTDIPQIIAALAKWGVPSRDFYFSTAAGLSSYLYGYLYYGRPAIYYCLGDGNGHYVTAVQMTGGTTGNPFDSLVRLEPYGGTKPSQSYAAWSSSLMRYYKNNMFAMIGIDRTPAVQIDTRIFGVA